MHELLAVARALADRSRLRALMALRTGELCACQITELLGLAASTVSKHMAILRDAGLVESRKQERWVYYRLASGPRVPKIVAEAREWALRHLAQDPAAVEDRDLLKDILRRVPSEACQGRAVAPGRRAASGSTSPLPACSGARQQRGAIGRSNASRGASPSSYLGRSRSTWPRKPASRSSPRGSASSRNT